MKDSSDDTANAMYVTITHKRDALNTHTPLRRILADHLRALHPCPVDHLSGPHSPDRLPLADRPRLPSLYLLVGAFVPRTLAPQRYLPHLFYKHPPPTELPALPLQGPPHI